MNKAIYFCLLYYVSLQEQLKKEPSYIMSDPHMYSIQDLINVKYGVLFIKLQDIVEICCMHVTDCEVNLKII